ncbi:DUF1516 family protein [Bacillus lacus]|uniref:UPF0344 protein GJU40_15310 n=1 Tax=Metabacillus lacus TaxID=1983721 RepID=A0A7X2J1B7_9BACI|nr:YisL family protein [Metabacillus lacus]MRX73511.1 DUF1516 family protein [Metabacillus lacus]
MTHMHITAWVLGIIIFFVAYQMHRAGKATQLKIVHMILRMIYVLIILTGILLLTSVSSLSLEYIIKAVVGLWTVGMMEMILVRGKKNKPTRVFWIQFGVAAVLSILLGLRLPLGFQIF